MIVGKLEGWKVGKERRNRGKIFKSEFFYYLGRRLGVFAEGCEWFHIAGIEGRGCRRGLCEGFRKTD